MAQLFPKEANLFSKLSIAVGGVLAAGAAALVAAFFISPYYTRVGVVQPQPVPFSHEHHVKGLGIDCRYCHTSVEKAAFAGIPPAKTCMTCHSQIWTNAEMLEPVRQAFQSGKPIAWTRLHNMPDYVYFNHSIHVARGVACVTCHGRVEDMRLMAQDKNMTMMWCLECHRDPSKFIQPRETVFASDWKRPSGSAGREMGKQLVSDYKIPGRIKMMDCYMCHR